MVNVDKLKGKIVEKKMTIEIVAKKIGVEKSTLYRKLSGKGDKISIGLADKIANLLCLTGEEATSIFFSQYVA